MTTFPGYIAWKSILPGPSSKGYSFITNNADLITAELNAQPGSWKWFPVIGGNMTSQSRIAATWAGVPYKGTQGGSPSANIPDVTQPAESTAQTIGKLGNFITTLGSRNTWWRIAEFTGGGILIIICLKTLIDETRLGRAVTANVKSVAKTTVKAGTVTATL